MLLIINFEPKLFMGGNGTSAFKNCKEIFRRYIDGRPVKTTTQQIFPTVGTSNLTRLEWLIQTIRVMVMVRRYKVMQVI